MLKQKRKKINRYFFLLNERRESLNPYEFVLKLGEVRLNPNINIEKLLNRLRTKRYYND